MTQPRRPRHVTHRPFDRQRHGDGMDELLAAASTTLDGTGASQAVTFAFGLNALNITGHGFATGDGPFQLTNAGGALPAELSEDQLYWVRVQDANTVTLTTSKEGLGTAEEVQFGDNGTGTHSIALSTTPEALFEQLRQGVQPETLRAATDVDDL